MDLACSMFSFLHSASIDFAIKHGSQSEIILSGNPVLVNTCLISRFAISSAFAVLLVGMRIIPFISLWSTTDSDLNNYVSHSNP